MYKWRNICVEFQDNIKNKIERNSARIEAIKKKFREEKDAKAEIVESQLKAHNVNVDALLQDDETNLLPMVKKCYEGKKIRRVRRTLWFHRV